MLKFVDLFIGSKIIAFEFIKKLNSRWSVDCSKFPHYESLVIAEYVHVIDENDNEELINADDVTWEYKDEYGIPDVAGWVYEFDIENVRNNLLKYKKLIDCLGDDEFDLKQEYIEMREYLNQLQSKQKPMGDSLFDLF